MQLLVKKPASQSLLKVTLLLLKSLMSLLILVDRTRTDQLYKLLMLMIPKHLLVV